MSVWQEGVPMQATFRRTAQEFTISYQVEVGVLGDVLAP